MPLSGSATNLFAPDFFVTPVGFLLVPLVPLVLLCFLVDFDELPDCFLEAEAGLFRFLLLILFDYIKYVGEIDEY